MRLLFLSIPIIYVATAYGQVKTDTTVSPPKKAVTSPSHWQLTSRIHTKGFFSYAGRLVSDNLTTDINFTYNRKKWGFLAFKALDLCDSETLFNFALITVFKNFKLSKKVSITSHIGAVLEQLHGPVDHGSDAACILITTYRPSTQLLLEHTSFFSNLLWVPEWMDWANRFRINYSYRRWDFSSIVWLNHAVFDHASHITGNVNITYGKIKLANHLFMSTGMTGFTTFYSSDEIGNPIAHRFMFTVAAQWIH